MQLYFDIIAAAISLSAGCLFNKECEPRGKQQKSDNKSQRKLDKSTIKGTTALATCDIAESDTGLQITKQMWELSEL